MSRPRPWKWSLDELIKTLVLIRLGQMLGTDSPAARAVHDIVEALLAAVR
jgi:hypothetical protein